MRNLLYTLAYAAHQKLAADPQPQPSYPEPLPPRDMSHDMLPQPQTRPRSFLKELVPAEYGAGRIGPLAPEYGAGKIGPYDPATPYRNVRVAPEVGSVSDAKWGPGSFRRKILPEAVNQLSYSTGITPAISGLQPLEPEAFQGIVDVLRSPTSVKMMGKNDPNLNVAYMYTRPSAKEHNVAVAPRTMDRDPNTFARELAHEAAHRYYRQSWAHPSLASYIAPFIGLKRPGYGGGSDHDWMAERGIEY